MLIVKGHPARLATQSEQFANELTRHLGICAPDCRILRKVVCAAPLQSYNATLCNVSTVVLRIIVLSICCNSAR